MNFLDLQARDFIFIDNFSVHCFSEKYLTYENICHIITDLLRGGVHSRDTGQ